MAALKSPSQLKAEHPEWDDKQAVAEFEKVLDTKVRNAAKMLRKAKEIVEMDPLYAKDDGAKLYAEMMGEAADCIDPYMGLEDPFEEDDEDNEWAKLDEEMMKHTKRAKRKK